MNFFNANNIFGRNLIPAGIPGTYIPRENRQMWGALGWQQPELMNMNRGVFGHKNLGVNYNQFWMNNNWFGMNNNMFRMNNNMFDLNNNMFGLNNFNTYAARLNRTVPEKTFTKQEKQHAIDVKLAIMSHPQCPSTTKAELAREIRIISDEIADMT
ncbi:MAG: hypothetical protein II085_02020 [Alphaproteobacteria bacterium]|nr:hypothetical protein [Alphaproteobacteria bacterium]